MLVEGVGWVWGSSFFVRCFCITRPGKAALHYKDIDFIFITESPLKVGKAGLPSVRDPKGT